MDIYRCIELALNHADRFVAILAINRPERWQNLTKPIVKHSTTKSERQPMLEAVDLILVGIKFDVI